jgi:WD40 repeat protein
VNSGKRLWEAKGFSLASNTRLIAWSPDGSRLAVGSMTTATVLDGETGKVARRWGGGMWSLHGLAWHPSGKSLAATPSLTTGEMLVALDVATGRERGGFVQSPPLPEERFNGLAGLVFSPDGRSLLSVGSNEPAVRVFEWESGRERRQFRWDGVYPESWEPSPARVWFAPDSRTLAVAYRDSTVLLWDAAGLTAEDKPVAAGLTDDAAGRLWDELLEPDATRADRAGRILAARPEVAVPVFRKLLKPQPPPKKAAPGRLAALVARLDAPAHREREAAENELAGFGAEIEPLLRSAKSEATSPEVRSRLDRLLARLDPDARPAGEPLRHVRAVEVLERIGTADARELLAGLAGGADGAVLTEEAKAALARLKGR